VHFAQSLTLRFPIMLNLLSAAVVLWLTLGLREPAASTAVPHRAVKAVSAWRDILNAGAWILRTPVALFAIVGGVLIDSVIRLFLTFGSVYYRLIDLPEASFGLIGAAMAGLGLVVSPMARRLVTTGSLMRNYALLAVLTLLGLLGVALKIPLWGVAFAIPLAAAMNALGFILSNALNAEVSSARRATVLSFKGLVFNLGYGFVSLLFALALRALRDGGSAEQADQAFASAIQVLPLWLLCTLGVLALMFRRHRAILQLKPTA